MFQAAEEVLERGAVVGRVCLGPFCHTVYTQYIDEEPTLVDGRWQLLTTLELRGSTGIQRAVTKLF